MAVTIKNPISVIKVGGGGDEPGGDAKIVSYDRATGVIEGTGFGSTAGTVYMLNRDTHTYVAQPASSWSSSSITLTTPLDLANLEGNTSIVVVKSDGTWSTKLVVYGDITVTGYAKVYIKSASTGVVRTADAASAYQVTTLYQSMLSEYSKSFTIGSDTFYADELVGIQFGSSFNYTSITQQNFLCDFINLNQPVIFPDTVTSLPTNCLCGCFNFNQPIKIAVTSIPNSFMAYCYNFNQPIEIPSNCTSIGYTFLGACYNFNQPLTLPTGLTTIGQNFLSEGNRRGTNYNHPLTIPNTVTSIGSGFLAGNNNFDQPISLPSTITTVPESFLYSCLKFNSKITLPNTITKIGGYFLFSCQSFNQPIEIPSSVTEIGDAFMSTNYNLTTTNQIASFNQEIILPSGLTKIGQGFMCGVPSFNHKIVVPSSVTNIGTYFLYGDPAISEVEVNTTTSPTDNYSLSSNLSTSKNYTKGITVTGTGATTWVTSLPNRTGSPFRKLIDGTA